MSLNSDKFLCLGAYARHWNILKLRQILKPFSQKNHPEMPLLSVVREKGVIIRNVHDKDENHNYVPDDLSGYKLVKQGQFVMNKMKAWQGSYGVSKHDGIVSPAYFVFNFNYDINKDFFNVAIRSKAYIRFFGQASDGIRVGQWDLSMERMKNIPFYIPPREEQDQIVRFLDWKVSRINKLINIKLNEIEVLEDLKRSIISYYVMGKNEKFTHKEAKTSWIKYIPKHWSEKTLIHFAEEQQIKNIGMIENNLLSLSYGKIVKKDINTTVGLLPTNFEGYQIVFDGNIILRLTDLQNDHKSLRTGIVTQKGIITSAYTCLKVRQGMLPEYLQLQLHVADLCKVFYGMGGGVRQSIGFKDIRNLVIVVPPIEEQQDILKKVHTTETRINQAIKKEKDLVESLNDLKARLIADTVTGQIDVRNIKIPDYETVTEDTADATDSEADEPEDQE